MKEWVTDIKTLKRLNNEKLIVWPCLTDEGSIPETVVHSTVLNKASKRAQQMKTIILKLTARNAKLGYVIALIDIVLIIGYTNLV